MIVPMYNWRKEEVKEEVQNFANQIKDLVIEQLAADGCLTEEEVEEFLTTYVVLFEERARFGDRFRKLFKRKGKESEDQQLIVPMMAKLCDRFRGELEYDADKFLYEFKNPVKEEIIPDEEEECNEDET